MKEPEVAAGPMGYGKRTTRRRAVSLAEGLMWVIFATLAVGVQVPGTIQPTRVLTVLAAFLSICGPIAWRHAAFPARYFGVMALFWLLWGIVSLTWTPDLPNGVHELVGLLLGAVTVLTLANLGRVAGHPLETVRLGWIAAVVATIPIAVVEVAFDWHMPISAGRKLVGGGDESAFLYASATFGNRNTYVAFLCLAFPFLLWSVAVAKTLLRRLFNVTLVIFCFLVVILDASRLGPIVLAAETCLWLFSFIEFRRWRTVFTVLVLLGAVVYGSRKVWESRSVVRLRALSAVSGEDESIQIRWALMKNGLIFIRRSRGMGMGAGSFAASTLGGSGLEDTSLGDIVIVDPHNIWLEVSAQYGVIVAALFVSWLVYCFVAMRPNRRERDFVAAARYGRMLLLGLPVVGLMNSAFLTFPIFWASMASVVIITDQLWLSRDFREPGRCSAIRK